MNSREQYTPGPASGASVRKDGEKWTLVLVRDLRHAPEKVWKAITEPEHLREWAPFDSDRNLGAVGTAMLTTVGAPALHVTETQVKRAEPPPMPLPQPQSAPVISPAPATTPQIPTNSSPAARASWQA